jgi:hypothetical protein
MKILILTSILCLSGCGYRCHDAINCHAVYHKHKSTQLSKTLLESPVQVRGAVYVEELY